MSIQSPPESAPPVVPPALKEMTIGEHLEELRWCILRAGCGLLVGVAVSLALSRYFIAFLTAPYDEVRQALGMQTPLMGWGVTGPFLVYFNVALLGGVLLSSPWITWQAWRYLSAGLYPTEKRYITTAVPICTALFLGGAFFFLRVVAKPLLMFFVGFAQWMGLQQLIPLEDYISLVVQMMIAFGLGFQTPMVIFLLVATGLTTTKRLARWRKHLVVAFLIIAAFMTSPSPIDQILLAGPMYLLFELGMLAAWILERRRLRRAA